MRNGALSRFMVRDMKAKLSSSSEKIDLSRSGDVCPAEKRLELPEIDEHAITKAAEMHKTLSDETRLKILVFLQDGELCVCDIVDALGKPQSTVSHHLFLLQNAGLIKVRKQGRWNMYSLSDTAKAHGDSFLKVSL